MEIHIKINITTMKIKKALAKFKEKLKLMIIILHSIKPRLVVIIKKENHYLIEKMITLITAQK